MSTDCTHCPTCGAPVDLTARSCPYCGVPYPKPRKTAQAVAIGKPLTVQVDGISGPQLAAMLERHILTPNEVRRRMGLPPL